MISCNVCLHADILEVMSTRGLVEQRVANARSNSRSSSGCAFACCVVAPLLVLYARQQQSAPTRATEVVESMKALQPLPSVSASVRADQPTPAALETPVVVQAPVAAVISASHAEHESSNPMAVLNRERSRAAGGSFSKAFMVYRPPPGASKPGGNLDAPATLASAVKASAADGEVMLLCVGGSGSMRTGMNLILNFRAMGLYHMLILAPERDVCDDLWGALPDLACVWWPSRFKAPRPNSLYNTMFSRTALAFFEARKRLLEQLVITYHLNVLHLDADTVWFANPYPLFKTIYASYSLIIQTDQPFVNAGILYVQNVHDGDAAAWVLQELNRRISRFTYDPGSVRELPSSAWSTPPHFANADEQANLNDIVTTSVIGRHTYSNGVEFYEARFKRDRGDAEARKRMADGAWMRRMQQGDVEPARGRLTNVRPDKQYEPLVHLCKPGLWVGVNAATLTVPNNSSAAHKQLLLAPEWLFSHFPYGAFFPSFRECHADSWGYTSLTKLEQRLCMPSFRVPVIMVHMAGLRNGQWGRRGVMRALGVWHESADTVATADWVSVRSDKLLVVDGPFLSAFTSMRDFDRFAARLLLLATLLGRRAVLPSMPCSTRWAQAAMEPRHLRGLEVGCGKHKQCIWLPMPHFKEAWCSGVDFLYSIDYEGMVDAGQIDPVRDVAVMAASGLQVGGTGGVATEAVVTVTSGAKISDARVLRLTGPENGDPLSWVELDGFADRHWRGDLPRRVEAALGRASFTAPQMTIMKDCMSSLATSRD